MNPVFLLNLLGRNIQLVLITRKSHIFSHLNRNQTCLILLLWDQMRKIVWVVSFSFFTAYTPLTPVDSLHTKGRTQVLTNNSYEIQVSATSSSSPAYFQKLPYKLSTVAPSLLIPSRCKTWLTALQYLLGWNCNVSYR